MNGTDGELRRFYFTFGYGQQHAGCVLPILARDFGSARDRMFELHGAAFCSQYTQEQWEAWKVRAVSIGCGIERELPEERAMEGSEKASVKNGNRTCEECGSLVDRSSKCEDTDTRLCFCSRLDVKRFAGNKACEKFEGKK